MKSHLLLAGACALALAACQPSGGGSGSTTAGGGLNLATLVDAAQQAAIAACKFLPTAETVIGIINSKSTGLATGEAIGSAICAAVNTPGVATPAMALMTAPEKSPTVNGVVVKGQFVK